MKLTAKNSCQTLWWHPNPNFEAMTSLHMTSSRTAHISGVHDGRSVYHSIVKQQSPLFLYDGVLFHALDQSQNWASSAHCTTLSFEFAHYSCIVKQVRKARKIKCELAKPFQSSLKKNFVEPVLKTSNKIKPSKSHTSIHTNSHCFC